jgi:hypothetical protein
MPDAAQVALALFGGLGFGVIISWIGTNWRLIGIMLLVLWTLTSGPQFLWRWLDGQDVGEEVVIVTALRATFLVATLVVVAITNHYDVRRTRPGAHPPWRKED